MNNKVYIVEEWETGEESINHIASTKEKAIAYIDNHEQFYYHISVYEVEVDNNDGYHHWKEVYTKEKKS